MPTMPSTPPNARGATGCSSPRRSPPDAMEIRRARVEDIPRLLALVRRYWDFEGISGFAALRIELVLQQLLAERSALGAVWVAETGGTLVGYLIVVLLMSVEHQGLTGEIDEFFVLPEARS